MIMEARGSWLHFCGGVTVSGWGHGRTSAVGREGLGAMAMYRERHATPLEWDGHLLLLHRSESERRSGLAAWVRRGLELDEKVICTEIGAAAPQRSVLSVLQDSGIDVASATAEGRLVVLPLSKFYPPGRQRDVVARALAEGYRAVRMSVETSAALRAVPGARSMDYERTMDELCRTHPVSALCQYDRAETTGEHLHQAAEGHVNGIRERQLSTSGSDDGLIIAGEIDMSNDELLMSAVRAATSQASGTFRLDLSRVTFLGVGGSRALVHGSQQFRDRGGNLVLVGLSPTLERILRVLRLDQLPHIELIRALR